jgi:multidrug efflux pump subunit AcrB
VGILVDDATVTIENIERYFEEGHAQRDAILEGHRRALFIPTFLATCAAAFLLVPWLGQDFFPNTDNGQFILHLRAKSGTRIEETAKLCDLVEGSIRREFPEREMDNILDNIGLPYSTINFMHSTSGLIGAGDADILVSLKEGHRATADYVERLREKLPREYPGDDVLFPTLGYRHSGVELWFAGARRYPNRGNRYRGQSRGRSPDAP